MTDQFDPTMRMHHDEGRGGEQAGMDPEGLMPADEALHGDEAEDTSGDGADALVPGSIDTAAVSQLLTEPSDQPAEGGRDRAGDDDTDAGGRP